MSSAVRVALEVAATAGFAVDRPTVLQDTNNTVIWLRPHDVVAKVGTQPHSREVLIKEHAIGCHLARQNAAIAPPLPGCTPQYDPGSGYTVTLWRRLPTQPADHPVPRAVAESLQQLHRHLATYPDPLPPLSYALGLTRSTLGNDQRMKALRPDDRTMLAVGFDALVARLAGHRYPLRALHGEPHGGNLLITPGGVRWIDFEASCLGPLEWDLAYLPTDALRAFPDIDLPLLTITRTLASACVATWCWARADNSDMLHHARHHLEIVRLAMESD